MSRPNLQVATVEAVRPVSMEEAIMGAARVCAAAMPVAALIAWEVNGKIYLKSVPDSLYLQKGLADAIFGMFFPPESE